MADTRQTQFIFGTSDTTGAVALTTAYTGNVSKWVNIEDAYQLAMDIAYLNNGAANSVQWKFEFANEKPGTDDINYFNPTNFTYYQDTSFTTTTGVSTYNYNNGTYVAVAASGSTDRIHVSRPLDSKFMRISFKETIAAGSAGTLIAKITLSYKNNK